MNIFMVFIGAALVNNFILSRFLGVCPFLGVSKKIETAVGMGLAVTFVTTLASASTYIAFHYLLVPKSGLYNLQYLYNIAFVLLIAALVQLVEMFLKKSSPGLYSSLGVYLPLMTTNCGVLGVAVINMEGGYNFVTSVTNAFGAGVGFLLALVLLAGIREKLEHADIPAPFRGFPITLIAAGLMSIAFLGFQGMLS